MIIIKKTLEIKTNQDCETFVYALTGLTLEEYAGEILNQFNKEKEGQEKQSA